MRAGTLRHRVTIQEALVTQNEFGEPVETWTAFAERSASVEPLRGRELFSAQQLSAQVTHRVRLRWLEGVSPTMRVLHKGRILEIEAVLNLDERPIELELMCMERDE